MPEAQLSKNQFQLNKGLNTESNEISSVDGFTTDERNYELLVDDAELDLGVLRRRSSAAPARVSTRQPSDR